MRRAAVTVLGFARIACACNMYVPFGKRSTYSRATLRAASRPEIRSTASIFRPSASAAYGPSGVSPR